MKCPSCGVIDKGRRKQKVSRELSEERKRKWVIIRHLGHSRKAMPAGVRQAIEDGTCYAPSSVLFSILCRRSRNKRCASMSLHCTNGAKCKNRRHRTEYTR